jgi:hypothetical protein
MIWKNFYCQLYYVVCNMLVFMHCSMAWLVVATVMDISVYFYELTTFTIFLSCLIMSPLCWTTFLLLTPSHTLADRRQVYCKPKNKRQTTARWISACAMFILERKGYKNKRYVSLHVLFINVWQLWNREWLLLEPQFFIRQRQKQLFPTSNVKNRRRNVPISFWKRNQNVLELFPNLSCWEQIVLIFTRICSPELNRNVLFLWGRFENNLRRFGFISC